MSQASSIAKNTIILYIRMFMTMGISLYTSRATLDILGVSDFGVYNLVAGVVTLFSFINVSMSTATSRFLTFEIGRKDEGQLRKMFSASLTIHLIMAVIILLLGLTIGLWFLNTKLVIPADRMNVARWIYFFSLISVMFTILQSPYNAALIAHESMDIYAYFSILSSMLKLLIVISLPFFCIDNLFLYGILLLLSTIFMTFCYKMYCNRHYKESYYKFSWDTKIFKPLLSFSTWDLYGNMSAVGRTQGVNMLLNIFFGTILNAAAAIATQVQTAVMLFASSIMTAARPQIVKNYASGNIKEMLHLLNNTAKYTYVLLLLVSLPIIFEMDFVLHLWLKNVPAYSIIFCQFTLIFNLISNFSFVIVAGVHATGKISTSSIINGTLYLLVLPLTYFAFKLGYNPSLPYIINIGAIMLGCLTNIYVLKRQIKEFSINYFIIQIILKSFYIAIIAIIPLTYVMLHIESGWLRFTTTILTSTIFIVLSFLLISTNKEERTKLINILLKRL